MTELRQRGNRAERHSRAERHGRAGRGTLCMTFWLAVLIMPLAACVSSSPRAAPPDHAQASTPALPQEPIGASYDWHVLLVAPLGSPLKNVPLDLHEVLLFRDESHKPTANEDLECYSAGAAAPRFVGRAPDEYLLCFKQDRLIRVQASVRLPAASAPQIFAAACGLWLKNAAAAAPIAAPGLVVPTPVSSNAETRIPLDCEGRGRSQSLQEPTG